jgi:Leucine-rich repeat (LRR) protein
MLTQIVLDYESRREVVDRETLFKYDGTKDLATLSSLEAVADTREMTLAWLGDFFPGLEKLRLNNSVIPSVRDISTSLARLRFLSLAHCGIASLDGIGTLSPSLEELYLAFNEISDVSELMGLQRLRVLDLEENRISRIADVEFLAYCPELRALTLAGNRAAAGENYRAAVMAAVPQLAYLDEKRLRPRQRQSVAVEPLEIAKVQKGEKCREKPRSAESLRSGAVVTEFVEAAVDARPPSSRAYGGGAGFAVRPPPGKKISPRVTRPVSGRLVRLRASYEGDLNV